MRRSTILDVTVGLLFDAVVVLSIYLLFAGHNEPGGGFIGGLVAGAGIGLRYVADGMRSVRAISPFRPWTVLAAGLVTASATALAPIVLGRAPLEADSREWDPPLLGHVKLTSTTIFDIGVYFVVVGLLLMVFEALGDAGEPA
jgi:multisubunit Na+/H+ antiporter MnhB subunit